MFEAKLLIDGKLTEASDGRRLTCLNPADESPIGTAPDAGAEDVRSAVESARKASVGWAALALDARIKYMRQLAQAVRARRDEIAELESRDTGNLYGPMLGDVERGAARVEYYAGLGHAALGATYPATNNHLHLSVREPFGVAARIVAFNHPFYFALSRLGAPLIAGNATIIKTPEQAPLSGGILAEICAEIFPPGVVSILSGTGERTGDALVRDPRVKRIGFIGSVGTAQRIQRSAADVGIKHITHELGGKNMIVVLPDADLDKAADLAIEGMNFQWQGQSCGSTSNLCIHNSIYDELIEKVRTRVAAIRPGDPFDKTTGMGPLINAQHHEKVMASIQAGIDSGATLLAGGKRPYGAQFEKGYWVEPTLFGDVQRDSALATQEFFGPILGALRWSKPEDICAIDDASDLGLTAAVVGKDVGNALAFARRLQVGYVWINCVGPHFTGVPYGGMKNSGVGREEGIEEILSYSEIKSINIAVPQL